ncbi:glutamate synthase subunit alpha [Phormidium pseudopriestleyi FRX01]|uniref:Glutamate synthase subunit alpha n=1 Tax=Phormidium pseudopriestleyi FRX01 TaxID=1759528 RepID=A0ABS3FTZ2_9CYAN|nr:glutamate synthase-related protein [Phormidium pseudopriestleyi]MBO0350598.1 glutamate synthase subunit alpha [Phormidium pseudopriestleyi FRX01]
MPNPNNQSNSINEFGFLGQPWLVEERDACGVGYIADRQNIPSRSIISMAMKALTCLEHRGGCSADRDSGDGAGVMTAIPWQLFQPWLQEHNPNSLPLESIGVGMVFFSMDPVLQLSARQIVEETIKTHDLQLLGWRKVPVRPEVLGVQARENQPHIEQVFVHSPDKTGDELERLMYLTRRVIGSALKVDAAGPNHQNPIIWGQDFYICSFSNRTIVYKGMVRSAVLSDFYLDLLDESYTSAFAVYHRRFSTNTLPRWPLAQPMRLLGHNGEINTLLGNINWMMARQVDLRSPLWGEKIEQLKPLVNPNNSDSANLDNVMELLVRSGSDASEALMIMVPEAYQNQPALKNRQSIVDFYEYYSGIQEPWDGPALIAYSDGRAVGATLDRNGLRPARYAITKGGLVMVASEAGVVDIPSADIIEKGRLGPGQTLVVDLTTHEILKNWEVKERIAQKHPYGEWLGQHRQHLQRQTSLLATQLTPEQLLSAQTAFGYTSEDVEMIIEEMAAMGKEPTFCMGDDIPLAVLSQKPRLLYDYFKQRFAQVTNPPIDPLRESLVMSLRMHLGVRGNLLEVKPEFAGQLEIDSPVLNEADLREIESRSDLLTLSTLFPVTNQPSELADSVQNLCNQAESAVRNGATLVILSDAPGPNTKDTYIPPLVAVGAVHHALIRAGLRSHASLIVNTAQCWSTHHFACLIGYGASAVCPYLALESVRHWHKDGKTQKLMERGKLPQVTVEQSQENYRHAIEAGLLKILSKMGISLLSSYHGAQIFEAIGIGRELLDLAFVGTASQIGGLSVAELGSELGAFHEKAFPQPAGKKLQNEGFVQYRPGGEYHMNSPEMSKALHKAVADTKGSGVGYEHYQVYKQYLAERPPTALRDLLDFKSDRPSVSIDEVEPVAEVLKRFCTGGMSLGALSREAHEVLAVAMNRIGGKSNSGEGGEDSVRFGVLDDVDIEGHSPSLPHLNGLKNGDTASSAIKQVASGRFGVTPEYLMNAKQIEIKMAQGAKPGEGGQLPGKKVSPYIAMLRKSKAGVPLISPPPHHDIYSIEDLAQLIFDLHQVNPKAAVSVKLVSSIGIGTIAAGVAKANADVIQISGHDGGTGASPLSSIKHAGSPWELGLAEVQRVLMSNGLRDRVVLRTDGGLKSGWDVLIAALMGAEEFGFGSIAMIAEGCIMARICHTNNCPVGVATQQEKLRARFTGVPEHVVNFFYFIGEEVRQLLAMLGYRSLQEVIGRGDLLTVRESVELRKTQGLCLDVITKLLPDTRGDRSWLSHGPVHGNGPVLEDELLASGEIAGAIASQSEVSKTLPIVNTDRSVGARLAGEIASRYGNNGFGGQINLTFQGSAGQSFGAFNVDGVTLRLEGEANDYVGKGMTGGTLVVVPPGGATYNPAENAIVGNTCLYGATGGYLFARGQAGQRFAVRNSLGKAVIEGAGDHACEYMTGGVIVVLGKTGRNVGAGMTGGLAYFLDEEGDFEGLVNDEIVHIQRVTTFAGEAQLKGMIHKHEEYTGSDKASRILENWAEYLPMFWQVVPPSEAGSSEVVAEICG